MTKLTSCYAISKEVKNRELSVSVFAVATLTTIFTPLGLTSHDLHEPHKLFLVIHKFGLVMNSFRLVSSQAILYNISSKYLILD